MSTSLNADMTTYYESSVESAAQMLREAQRAGRRVRVWSRGRVVTAAMEASEPSCGYGPSADSVTYYGKGATMEEALFNLAHHEAF